MSNTHSSVTKMMDTLFKGDPLSDELKKRTKERKVVKALQAMRIAKDIPQSRIAEELKCGQSRVSKIENGGDGDLSLLEVEAYARALNCDVNIIFTKRGETAVDRVKRHANAIRRELDQLAECAHSDEDIALGVAAFMGEALFNLLRIVEKSCEKMPVRPENGEPYIKICSTIIEDETAAEEGEDELPKLVSDRNEEAPKLVRV